MKWDLERVRANVQVARDEDLLDRATVYRAGMEQDALDIIEQELFRRGHTAADLVRYEESRTRQVLQDSHGIAYRCRCCPTPAVWSGWHWHRLWGKLPLVPVWGRYCTIHSPERKQPTPANEQ